MALKLFLQIIGPLLTIFVFQSCKHDSVIPPATVPLSFSKAIAPIIVANCTNCHTHQGNGERSFTTNYAADQLDSNKLRNYIVPGSPHNSQLYKSITSLASPMPPNGPMPEGDIIQLFLWIKEGANYSN